MNLDTLVAKVRATFPDLAFRQATLEHRGGDYWVLLLDAEYAFRFPRRSDNYLYLELAVLSALQQRCELPTPRYEFVAPDFSFAGYRFLPGTELTSAVFSSLSGKVKKHVLDQAVVLLRALHSLEPLQIAPKAAWRKSWAAMQYAMRGRQRLLITDQSFPLLSPQIEEFYSIYECDRAPRLVVVHGDFNEDHLLLSRNRDGLTGIIDFGDVGLGDPADDLKGFWTFGAAAAKYVMENHPAFSTDPGLLERSIRAYQRYHIDRFAELLLEGRKECATLASGNLHRLLSAP